jgi:DNA processing protein
MRLTGDRLPRRLFELPDPPAELYVQGELPRAPAVAIVGTRHPTLEGIDFAERLAFELARRGIVILSGGAAGIDAAAHRGALEGKGCTVVVAPAGREAPYPPEHAGLFRKVISAGGAYVSLVPDDRPATPSAFFARNRCLVALSQVVIVVQAPLRSGARNAAAHARELGRPVLAVPSCPWIPEGRGCLAELRLGATPCEGARDVLHRLHALGAVPIERGTRRKRRLHSTQSAFDFEGSSELERDAARVLAASHDGAVEPDELCRALELPAARIQRVLLTLRLRGVLVPGPQGGLIIRNSPY